MIGARGGSVPESVPLLARRPANVRGDVVGDMKAVFKLDRFTSVERAE